MGNVASSRVDIVSNEVDGENPCPEVIVSESTNRGNADTVEDIQHPVVRRKTLPLCTRILLAILLPFILLIVLAVVIWIIFQRQHRCEVLVSGGGLPEPQPLILLPEGSLDVYGFKLPTGRALNFHAGERVVLSCPGSANYLKELGVGAREAVGTCVSGTTFDVEGSRYNFTQLACKVYPYHIARRTGSTCNEDRATEIEIGFQTNTSFYRIIEVCFDERLLTPVYTKINMAAQAWDYQKKTSTPRNWMPSDFFGKVLPKKRYTRYMQIATFGKILGDVHLAEKYISKSDSSQSFLSRGHLAAKADFIYSSQQRATFYYINAAPQWQTFNGGNWERLESSVRMYATVTDSNLVVFTGVHGIMTLPDVDGVEQELYLYVDENNNGAMPVPKLFWKAVYNPKTRAGAVFLGVNNPYIDHPTKDYFICKDVSSKISWLMWSPKNQTLGFSYVCEVDDFRKIVNTLHWLEVDKLLA